MALFPVAVDGRNFARPLVLAPATKPTKPATTEERCLERHCYLLPHMPGVATVAEVWDHVAQAAAVIGLVRRAPFGTLVRALLEHGTLDEAQVRAIWDTAADVVLRDVSEIASGSLETENA
jgi:hypothetical protein